MPNFFAYTVLFLWPIVVLVLFRRLPFSAALVWSVLGGYLFLPEGTKINLPLLPAYDKVLVPSLSALVIGAIIWRQMAARTLRGAVAGPSARSNVTTRTAPAPRGRQKPATEPVIETDAAERTAARQRGRWIANLLILVLFANIFSTGLTNPEGIVAGVRNIPAMRLYDSFSSSLGTLVMLLPFFLGRRYLGTPQAHRVLLKSLVMAGLIYSALILVEVRLSPQLNRWVYGFYSHEFIQHIRNNGFRPMGFVGHGLRVGIFIAMTVLAAFALFRLREEGKSLKWLALAGWLFVILFLSKTLGAFMITLVLIPVAGVLGVRGKLLAGVMIAAVVLTYPLLRSSGVLTTERVIAVTSNVTSDRINSLRYRLENEDILLEKAMQKPASGWGGWGRNRVYDPETGRDISETDGVWIIEMGKRGWIGYLAVFGLLTLPALALFLRQGRLGLDGATGGLVLVHSANLVDMLPNSSLTPVTWLIAGALLARYEMGPVAQSAAPDEARLPRRALHQRRAPPLARQAAVPAGGKRRP